MINSKQRAKLMSISMNKKVTEHIGKDGISKGVLEQISNNLDSTVKDIEDNAWGNKIKRTLDQNNWG